MTVLAGFEAYSGQHYLLLAIFAVGAVGIVLLGRRQRGTDSARRFSRVLALLIPLAAGIIGVVVTVWLALQRRRRAGEKYEGLRVLR